jgi:hypothetical protein
MTSLHKANKKGGIVKKTLAGYVVFKRARHAGHTAAIIRRPR